MKNSNKIIAVSVLGGFVIGLFTYKKIREEIFKRELEKVYDEVFDIED